MVTFVCEYCDLTLRKNQCDKHVAGRCRPAALICIDCSKTFRGSQYQGHISCISEMDKHWGQYAPSKAKNGAQNNKNVKQEQKKQQSSKTANQQNQSKKEEQNSTNWKGWKNEIKQAIIEQSPQQKKIQIEALKSMVLKRYHQQFQQTDKDETIFLQKLQKLKKVKMTTYVTLD